MNVRTLIAFSLFSSTVGAVTPGLQPEAVVQQYCDATRGQEQLMQGSSMSVVIAASLPKLKKQGKLHALRRVSALGRITYEILGFEGDGTIKKQIINRYLSAEAEAQEEPTLSVAITPENYKFTRMRKTQLEGRDTYLFDVSPKHKRQGLFQGQLWIDSATFLRVQESGYLVKSPSVMLKKVAFMRKYQIRDGIAVPRQEQSVIDTRLGVGQAEMTIDFSDFAMDSPGVPEIQ